MTHSSPDLNRPSIAVSGGAGYLGRCVMDYLLQKGITPICLDNYSTGHRFFDPRIPCYEVELTDPVATREVWKQLPPLSGIFHFAAKALVGESTSHPALYFRNNLLATIHLAELAAESNVPFVHSSSCAVYGLPSSLPISESSACFPISPYGETKRISEQILYQFSKTQKLRVLNLRYFNPSGSLPGASHGECHFPETHLIPNILAAGLEKKPVSVYGKNHPTRDGSCVRDFIHVQDLSEGHWFALKYLQTQAPGFNDAVNLGSGQGQSVLEVIEAARKEWGLKLQVKFEAPREGDPPELVAQIEKAARILGWRPKLTLEAILHSHWEWEQRRRTMRKSP
jgi:UDP-glucose 4-epimerase